jgi:transposase
MLTKDYQVTISVLHQQGMSARAIARELGVARDTVRGILSGTSDGNYGPRKPRPTKLGPYHDYLVGRVKAAAPSRFAATDLLREIRELGYDGGISQLKQFLATLQPQIAPEALQRFETLPGQQMQIDFVVFRRGISPLRAFTACLGYSRMTFVRFTDNERAETWAECIERAFQSFGGTPRSLLCDNAKSIVTQRHAYAEGKHKYHAFVHDMMKHYSVKIGLCRPYRAQTKGKVERFHRYLRQSFFLPLQSYLGDTPVDVATANREVPIWLDAVANSRIHATLKERPCDRFLLERPSLQPLPLPYGGISAGTDIDEEPTRLATPTPIESFQHSLQTYEQFAQELRG